VSDRSTLERWQADPVPFAIEACGQRALVEWQRDELRAMAYPGRVSALVWGRQSGKSMSFALTALWVAFTRAGAMTMVVSGGGDQGGRRIVADVSRIVAASPLLRSSVVEETASVIRFDNGSTVRSVAASESSIRGWSVDALLIDEAQLLSDELILSAAMPTVTARRDAFIVMAGTAGRAEGAFYDLFRQGETGVDGVRASRRVSRLVGGDDEMPWQNPTMMARLQGAMGAVRVDAELRGIFATGSGYMFGAADLDPITADYRADALGSMRGPVPVRAGLDIAVAKGGDHTALVALAGVAVPGVERRMFAVRCVHRWPSGTPLVSPESGEPGVFEEIARSPGAFDSLRVDASGLGEGFLPMVVSAMRRRPLDLGGGRPPGHTAIVTEDPYAEDKPRRVRFKSDELRQKPTPTSVRGVKFSSSSKQAMYGALSMLVERRQLLLPQSATELRRELLALKTGLTASGNETFAAEGSGHDDLVDALVLALTPYKRQNGTWRTRVGDLANLPAYPAGSDGAEWASTASGLRVPRRPAWRDLRARGMTPTEPTGPPPVSAGALHDLSQASAAFAALDRIDRKRARHGR
jgi:hypothetical protein